MSVGRPPGEGAAPGDLAPRRLESHRLTGTPFDSARQAVGALGAVQAQDFGGAKWALGQRVRDLTEAEVDRLFDEGAILRTHVMRPTWHLALAEDVGWLLELTAPRLKRRLAGRWRQLEIDGGVIARAEQALTSALAGARHLTRPELGDALGRAGLRPEGQRLAHLLLAAELEALIVSGPRRGRQLTYALLEERAPRPRRPDRLEALAELAKRYFTTRGPAQLQDFAWWSGLTAAEARQGLELAAAALAHEVVDGREHWFDPEARPPSGDPAAHLLPNFDEYAVAYRDRAALLHPDHPFEPALYSFGSVLANVVAIGGRVRAPWRRTRVRGGVRVEVFVGGPPAVAEKAAVEAAVGRLGAFLECPAELVWAPPA